MEYEVAIRLGISPYFKAGQGKSVERQGFPKQAKASETASIPSVRNPTETQLHNCNIRRGLTLDHAGSLIVSSDSESL